MDPHLHQRASQPPPPPPAPCMRTMQMMLPRWERESVFYPFCDLMNIKAYLPLTHTHGHIDYFMHCGKIECIKRNESLLTFQQVVLPCFLKHRFAKTLICLKSLLHSQNTVHFLQNSHQYWSSGKCDRLYALLRYFCVLFSNTEDTVQH